MRRAWCGGSAIEGAEGVYVVSRDFRVPPSKQGGTPTFAEGQDADALTLMTAIGTANSRLRKSLYLCGRPSKDARCEAPAAGATVLASGAELERLLRSVPYRALITKALAAVLAELTKSCASADMDRSSVAVLKPADGTTRVAAGKASPRP